MVFTTRIFIHVCLPALVAWCAWLPVSAEDAASEALLETIASAQRSLTTITGTLVQRTSRREDATEPPRVLSGTYAIELPNHYDLVFTRPDDDEWRQRLCSDGEQRWRIEQSFAGQAPDVHRESGGDEDLNRLLTCLRLDVDALRKDFILTATPMPDAGAQVVLLPQPTATQIARQIERITAIFAADHHLTRLTIDDPQGNRYEITMLSAEYGTTLPSERFRGPAAP